MKRLTTIRMIAILLWTGAALALAAAIILFFLSPSIPFSFQGEDLIAVLIPMVVLAAAGVGLWLMKAWGWWIAQLALIGTAMECAIGFLRGLAMWRERFSTAAVAATIAYGAILLLVVALIVVMSLKNTWRRIFPRARGDTPPGRLFIHVALVLACVITIYPALRIISVSLRPGDRLLSTSLDIIPPDATLNNFYTVLFEKQFPLWLWNSLVITVATALAGVVLAATSAYAFSRWRFPGRGPGLVFLLATQMIPAAMLTVPLYVLAKNLGLFDTYRGLVLAYSVSSIPFSIWILKGYYDTIPIDLEEAAMIDGASRMTAFTRIVLPLSTPALAIVFLFNFMTAWNDFLLARIMLQKEQMLTWTRGLERMQSQFQTEWGAFAAASILVSIPVMALFLYSSKWLISGLTLGSVKG